MKQNSQQTSAEEMNDELVPDFGYERFAPSPIKAEVAQSLKRTDASVMDFTRSISIAAKGAAKNVQQSKVFVKGAPASPKEVEFGRGFAAHKDSESNPETISKQRRKQSPVASQELKRRQLNDFSRRPVIEKTSEFVTGTESTARTNTDSVAPTKKKTVQTLSYPESYSVPKKSKLPLQPSLPSNHTNKGTLVPFQIDQLGKRLSDGSATSIYKTLSKNIFQKQINLNAIDFLDRRSNRMAWLAPTKRGDKSCSKVSAAKVPTRNNVRAQISQFYDSKKDICLNAFQSPPQKGNPSPREERLPSIDYKQLNMTFIPSTCLKMIKDMGDYAGIARKLKRSVEDINDRPIRLI